jgi:hypothetical protein
MKNYARGSGKKGKTAYRTPSRVKSKTQKNYGKKK